MINSDKNFIIIEDSLAVLRSKIKQSGILGRLNINKSCENLVMRLMNLTYGYDLTNLNEKKKNFAGLDLGDEDRGIAIQVTSEKTTEKIDETLRLVLRYEHYKTFPQINIFILSNKQRNYSVKVETSPHFEFSPDINIYDFDTLLSRISNCPPYVIESIAEFMQIELPTTLNTLKFDAQIAEKANSLIDNDANISKSKLGFYHHWRVKMTLGGNDFSSPVIFKTLNNTLSTDSSKRFLHIFYPANLKSNSSKLVRYIMPLAANGSSNNFKESILEINPNEIIYEYAHYSNQENLSTALGNEIGGTLTLLIAIKQLFKRSSMDVRVEFELTTNGKLYLLPGYSLYKITNNMVNYLLDPSVLKISSSMYSVDNDSLIELMEGVLHGFAGQSDGFGFPIPYAEIDLPAQQKELDLLKNLIYPSEF